MAGPNGFSDSTPRDLIPPFLAWAGGKRHLVRRLLPLLPRDLESRMYREPFLGAGSLFFAAQPHRAILSDANEHLIRCYECVRDDADRVAAYLREHAANTGGDYYYRIRSQYNRSKWSAAQAARFVYLNKACFNAIFRVNRDGHFNVPRGRKKRLVLPDRNLLRRASEALQNVKLEIAGFQDALLSAGAGDFVYLDPPYPPLNGTSFFRHYTTDRFNVADHETLAAYVRDLDADGCLVLMTNADTKDIRRLYKGFNMISLCVTRYVSCKAKKHRVRELVITNYEVTDG